MTFQAVIPEATRKFGLSYSFVGQPQKGYRNESYCLTLKSGEKVNLIFHKNEREALERMKSADQASDALRSTSFPVRTRFDSRTLKLSDGKNDVYAGLYTYLPGNTIPWEAYTKDHIKLLGWAMSDMHSIWGLFNDISDIYITDELRAQLGRMERYFSASEVKSALEDKLRVSVTANLHTCNSLFNQLDKELEPREHTLHMDFVRGNVLFDSGGDSVWSIGNTTLTGVIDFEKAATGHRVFDIARTLAFLLVDCAGKDRQSIFKYFLQSGYNKRGKGSFKYNDVIVGMPAYRVLNMLIGFFLLHDFYKFLKHTPFESLESNHHFIRTRNILVDYGMIRYHKD